MTSKRNRQWRLVARPVGLAKESDFEWVEERVPEPGEGEYLVHNLYLSLDPTNRGWMNEAKGYIPPLALGDVMRSFTIGVVEKSRHPNFPEGTFVQGLFGWQDYAISSDDGTYILQHDPSTPLTAHFSLYGFIGPTAYFGLLDLGKPQPGETLVVSTAAGAVGSLVGQIGKIKGCRVVGIAGSEEKCRWIKEDLGFDAAINYKTEPVFVSLKRHCPDGIDIHFENVGGEILEAVLSLMNLRARIVMCGMIAQYNSTRPVPGPYNIGSLIVKRARMEGFIASDYWPRYQEAYRDLRQWHAEGKLHYREDVVEGLENAPRALNMLFDGSNKGKLIVKI